MKTVKEYSPKKVDIDSLIQRDDDVSWIILSFCHTFGVNTEIDVEKAKNYCIKSANRSNNLAKGFLFYNGWDKIIDYKSALHHFMLAKEEDPKMIKEDTSYLYFIIGFMHEKGFGLKIDYKKAWECIEISAKLGNIISLRYFFF